MNERNPALEMASAKLRRLFGPRCILTDIELEEDTILFSVPTQGDHKPDTDLGICFVFYGVDEKGQIVGSMSLDELDRQYIEKHQIDTVVLPAIKAAVAAGITPAP